MPRFNVTAQGESHLSLIVWIFPSVTSANVCLRRLSTVTDASADTRDESEAVFEFAICFAHEARFLKLSLSIFDLRTSTSLLRTVFLERRSLVESSEKAQ
jgi:hypothetical protein